MDLSQHLRELDTLLAEHALLWQPQPFKQRRPDWCVRLPKLCTTLLALSDDELLQLTADSADLVEVLAEHVPALATLEELTRLPEYPSQTLNDLGPHFHTGIPGRKWEQIKAFNSAMGSIQAPLLEWCGGKGHLGRLLSAQSQQPVLTLEYNERLCKEGERLAQRSRIAQTFLIEDALTPSADAAIKGRHAVALHACGELHRSLVQRAVDEKVPALDIAPCCYHLYGDHHYRSFTPELQLKLNRDDLRLAVTETITAVDREVRRRDQEMAWKLGYDQLRRESSGVDTYQPIKPIDKAWLNFDFPGFCQALAERDGITLPVHVDWQRFEDAGRQRQHETMRLSLVRHAFRRAIELWLVLDPANYLAVNGYRVTLGTFCESSLTPRNILISARR